MVKFDPGVTDDSIIAKALDREYQLLGVQLRYAKSDEEKRAGFLHLLRIRTLRDQHRK